MLGDFSWQTAALRVPINLPKRSQRTSYLFMRDMSWLGNVCQASRWSGHQWRQLTTSEALSQILPSVPCCGVPFLAPFIGCLLLSAALTDDNSVGVRGHGLTGKGIIIRDNHRRTQTVNNKLAAENNNRHNFSKARSGLGLVTRSHTLWLCINAESGIHSDWCGYTWCPAWGTLLRLLILTRLPCVFSDPNKQQDTKCVCTLSPLRSKGFSVSPTASQMLANYKELTGIIIHALIAGIF